MKMLKVLCVLSALLISASAFALDSSGVRPGVIENPSNPGSFVHDRDCTVLYYARFLVIDDEERLMDLGYDVVATTDAADLAIDNLLNYNVLIIFLAAPGVITAYQGDISTFVEVGGSLFIHQPGAVGMVDFAPAGFEVEIRDSGWEECGHAAVIVDGSHALTMGFTDDDLAGDFAGVGDLGDGYTLLTENANCGDPQMAVGAFGQGRVLFDTSNFGANSFDPGSDAFVTNLMDWLCMGVVSSEETTWSELKAIYR